MAEQSLIQSHWHQIVTYISIRSILENFHENHIEALYLMVKTMVSCRFSQQNQSNERLTPFSPTGIEQMEQFIQERHPQFILRHAGSWGPKKTLDRWNGGDFFATRWILYNCIYYYYLLLLLNHYDYYDYYDYYDDDDYYYDYYYY